ALAVHQCLQTLARPLGCGYPAHRGAPSSEVRRQTGPRGFANQATVHPNPFSSNPRTYPILTAKECLQSAEACLALAHKTKKLDTRAALLEFAYEFRTVAKRLERGERMVRVASPIHGECAPR